MPDRIKVTLTEDKTHATLDILTDHHEGGMTFTTDQLLALVQGLGRVHKSMLEGQDLPKLEGQHVDLVVDTRWAIGSDLLGEATVMSFFHPAFGPVGFLVPIDQVDQIARKLLSQVEKARESRQHPN